MTSKILGIGNNMSYFNTFIVYQRSKFKSHNKGSRFKRSNYSERESISLIFTLRKKRSQTIRT